MVSTLIKCSPASLPFPPYCPPRYGFNPGSNLRIDNYGDGSTVGRVAVCTTLSAAASGIVSLVLVHHRSRTWDMLSMCTGALGGETLFCRTWFRLCMLGCIALPRGTCSPCAQECKKVRPCFGALCTACAFLAVLLAHVGHALHVHRDGGG